MAFNLTEIQQEENKLFLSDVSARDFRWDIHRLNLQQTKSFYQGSEFSDYATEMGRCAQVLRFKVLDGELHLDLAPFCRKRYCPICMWRKSLKWKAKAHQLMPLVLVSFPSHRWIFLTLTIRNVQIQNLAKTVQKMNRAFSLMSRRRAWMPDGWIKSLEVTRSKDGSAHPHFHVLLMVPGDYFSGAGYLKQSSWSQLWKNCLDIDYTPIVDVRAIPVFQNPAVVIPEIFKYQTKAADFLRDRNWFLELTRQMHHVRAVAVGGVLRSILRELTQEPEDLIYSKSIDESDSLKDCPEIYFRWLPVDKRYSALEENDD
jgi:plasmid rolling circle replication initiator protein Rep